MKTEKLHSYRADLVMINNEFFFKKTKNGRYKITVLPKVAGEKFSSVVTI